MRGTDRAKMLCLAKHWEAVDIEKDMATRRRLDTAHTQLLRLHHPARDVHRAIPQDARCVGMGSSGSDSANYTAIVESHRKPTPRASPCFVHNNAPVAQNQHTAYKHWLP